MKNLRLSQAFSNQFRNISHIWVVWNFIVHIQSEIFISFRHACIPTIQTYHSRRAYTKQILYNPYEHWATNIIPHTANKYQPRAYACENSYGCYNYACKDFSLFREPAFLWWLSIIPPIWHFVNFLGEAKFAFQL